MSLIADCIRFLAVGEAAAHAGLTACPFPPDSSPEPDYLPRDEAPATEYACVREISEGGTVATITFVNDFEQPVPRHGGDLRVGTEQNGGFALSIVVLAQADIICSDACVERGYGGYHAYRTFSAASHSLYTIGRAHIARSEFESLRRRRQPRMVQTGLCADITKTSALSNCFPPQGMLGARSGCVLWKHEAVGAGESDRFDIHRISGGAPTSDERATNLHAFAADADPLSGLKFGPLNELIS